MLASSSSTLDGYPRSRSSAVVAQDVVVLPALPIVVADHGALAVRLAPAPVGPHQGPARVREQVRRAAVEVHRFRPRPGEAAVVRLGVHLHEPLQPEVGGVDPFPGRLEANQPHQLAAGQLGDVGLVVVPLLGSRKQGHGSQRFPGAAFVPALHGCDGADAGGEAGHVHLEQLAEKQQLPAGEQDRPVRGGLRHPDRGGPGVAAVPARPAPGPDPLVGIRAPGPDQPLLPQAPLLLVEVGIAALELPAVVGGEPGQQQAPAAAADDPGVAVVERRVVDDAGVRPGAALVGAGEEDAAPERADVFVAEPRGGRDKGPVRHGRDGRPAEVAEKVVGKAGDGAVFGFDPAVCAGELHGLFPLLDRDTFCRS